MKGDEGRRREMKGDLAHLAVHADGVAAEDPRDGGVRVGAHVLAVLRDEQMSHMKNVIGR